MNSAVAIGIDRRQAGIFPAAAAVRREKQILDNIHTLSDKK